MTSARSSSPKPTAALPVKLLPAVNQINRLMVASAVLNGTAIDAKLQDAIIDVERERTMLRSSLLTLSIADPEMEILRSQILNNRIDLELPSSGGQWVYDRPRSIGGYSHDGGVLQLRLWDLESASLKSINSARVWSGKTMSLEGLVAALCGEAMKEVRGLKLQAVVPNPGELLSPVTPVVQRTVRRADGGTDPVGSATTTVRGFPAGAAAKLTSKGHRANAAQVRVLAAVIEEADRCNASPRVQAGAVMAVIVESNCGEDLRTTGDDDSGYFQQGRPWISAANARDPAKGCRAFLLGPDANVGGTGKGDDPPGWKQTHGSVRKATGDLGAMVAAIQRPRSDLRGQYARWESEAVRAVDLWHGGSGETKIPRPSAGGTAASTSTTETTQTLKRLHRPTEWRRGQTGHPESSWTMLDRYAKSFGRRRFVSAGRLVVADDDQLIRAAPHQTFAINDPNLLRRPSLDIDGPGGLETLTLTAPATWWTAPPGAVVDVQGGGPADGPWLVATLRDTAGGVTVDVELTQPATEDPDRQTRKIKTTTITPGTAASGAAAAASMAPGGARITATGGAKGIVDQAAALARAVSGPTVYVGSDFRGGSITTSGNPSDHAGNDAGRAARDIGVRGIDLLVGPPSSKLDAAVVMIGKEFGRDYGRGNRTIIDTFQWRGFRVQIIWRTPLYGGHMGHIHIGVRR